MTLLPNNKSDALIITEHTLLRDCINETELPSEYRVKRPLYQLDVAVQSGFKDHMPRMYFQATDSAGAEAKVVGNGVMVSSNSPLEYQGYDTVWVVPDNKDKELVVTIIGADDTKIGSEVFKVVMESCLAITIDSI